MVPAVVYLLCLSLTLGASARPVNTNYGNSPSQIRIPDGYSRILFQDDFFGFTAGSLPSPSKWAIDTGIAYPGGPAHWGTNEVQTYTNSPANIAVTSSSSLLITPVKANGRWTSARLETTPANDFACGPGQRIRMEASLRLGAAAAPTQLGIWPAFWSLGSSFRGNYNNWPAVGEIDILETLNGAATAWQTLHCGTSSGGPCHETTGISSTAALSRGEWHTVALEIDRTGPAGDWRAETITWLVDGIPTTSVSGKVVGDPTAWAALAHSSRFLILNVAVGGSFPDAIAHVTTPTAQTVGGSGAAMEVKYVAVYST